MQFCHSLEEGLTCLLTRKVFPKMRQDKRQNNLESLFIAEGNDFQKFDIMSP